MTIRKLIVLILLVLVLLGGGWSLYHRDQIQSPSDFFRLAGTQLDRLRSQLAPTHTASWKNRKPGTLRIASFNCRGFSEARLANPWFDAVMTRLVGEHDVIALQEVAADDPWLLTRFLKRFEQTGKSYEFVLGSVNTAAGDNVCHAIIYNTAVVSLESNQSYSVQDPDGILMRKPLVAWFRASTGDDMAFTFSLVNAQLNPQSENNEVLQLGPLFRAVRNDGRMEDDVIIAGDLGIPARQLLEPSIAGGLSPLIRYVATSTAGDAQPDNFLIDAMATSEFTGDCGVVDFMKEGNLTLAEAETVSDHLPVWAEFSVREFTGAGRVANVAPHDATH